MADIQGTLPKQNYGIPGYNPDADRGDVYFTGPNKQTNVLGNPWGASPPPQNVIDQFPQPSREILPTMTQSRTPISEPKLPQRTPLPPQKTPRPNREPLPDMNLPRSEPKLPQRTPLPPQRGLSDRAPVTEDWNGQPITVGKDYSGEWLSSKDGKITVYSSRAEAEAAGGDYFEPNFLRHPMGQFGGDVQQAIRQNPQLREFVDRLLSTLSPQGINFLQQNVLPPTNVSNLPPTYGFPEQMSPLPQGGGQTMARNQPTNFMPRGKDDYDSLP